MDILGKAFHKLRVWMGLADASESHLTPSHGWLLPAAADTLRPRNASEVPRAAHIREGNVEP